MRAPSISPPAFWGTASRMPRSWHAGCVCSTSTLAARFVQTCTQKNSLWTYSFTWMLLCSSTADNNWHFFDFQTFCRTKKKALLDVCLNEYETVDCQLNLIPLFPTGVLGGPILLLPTSPAGGQSDRIHFSPLPLAGKQLSAWTVIDRKNQPICVC